MRRRALVVSESIDIASQAVPRPLAKTHTPVHAIRIEPVCGTPLRLLHEGLPITSSDPPDLDELVARPLSNIQEVNSSFIEASNNNSEKVQAGIPSSLGSEAHQAPEGAGAMFRRDGTPERLRSSRKRSRLGDSPPLRMENPSSPVTATLARDRAFARSRRNGPTENIIDTPCNGLGRRPGRLALAPIMNRSNATKATTLDLFTDGQGVYAEAETGPVDLEKKQRQEEAFRAVTPITGRGPFSYYTNSALLPATSAQESDICSCCSDKRSEAEEAERIDRKGSRF